MTEERKTKLIERIQKLLALSSSPNEHEAALASARAQELLLKYNLTMGEVELNREEAIETIIDLGKRRPERWISSLLGGVCKAFDCQAINLGGGRLSIIGGPADCEAAKFTFNYLHQTTKRLATRYVELHRHEGHAKSIRYSYSLGVVFSVTKTLRDMKEKNKRKAEQADPSTGAALVRIEDQKNLHINNFLAKHYPRLTTSRARFNVASGSAFSSGKKDGKNVRIRRGIGGTGTRALKS